MAAGTAFGFLGARAIQLEQTEAGRSATDRAEAAVGLAAALLPQVAAKLPRSGEDIVRDGGPGFALSHGPTMNDNRVLLAEQAEYLERTKDLPGAERTWIAVAEFGPKSPLDVDGMHALTRAAAVAALQARYGQARTMLQTVLGAPLQPGDEAARALAERQAFRLAMATSNDRAEALLRLISAAGDGRILRFDGAPDRGDLLIAADREVDADPRPLDPMARSALKAAAARADRGHRLLNSLRRASTSIADGYVGLLSPFRGELRVFPLHALSRALSARVGQTVRVREAASVPHPFERRARSASPYEGLEIRAFPDLGSGTQSPSFAWIALASGLLLFTGGGAFALVALLRAERAARMQSDFVAAVSHEMKTPIAGVQAMAEMLAEGRVSEPGKAVDYAERIRAEMGRLGATVRDVLDVARIERDPTALVRPLPLDPGPVVLDAVAVARPALERRGFTVRTNVLPSPTPLPIDADALAHVLHNLLDNAAKFSIDRKEIDVFGAPLADGGAKVAVGSPAYRIEVCDRGPGIPPESRPRVFERFFRGEDARHRAIPGIGLGLHVAREIVQAHGGTIQALERLEGGARMVIELPAGGMT